MSQELTPTIEQRVRDLENMVSLLRVHKHGPQGEVLAPL